MGCGRREGAASTHDTTKANRVSRPSILMVVALLAIVNSYSIESEHMGHWRDGMYGTTRSATSGRPAVLSEALSSTSTVARNPCSPQSL